MASSAIPPSAEATESDNVKQLTLVSQTNDAAEEWLQRSGIEIRTINVVGTLDLETPVELKTIALHARNAEYNPKRFSAVIMRLRQPKTTGLIFASGKVVITGARDEEKCRLAARKFARVIQKLNFPAKFGNFIIQNVVGTCDVEFPIRLEGLANDHHRFSSYEPELFPGLIYRLAEPKLVLLVFVSGKLVITGAKSAAQLRQAVDKLYPVLIEHRKLTLAPGLSVSGGDAGETL